ncbi:MAG: LuxR C-terminal-related transcriptional regulator [Anaerolineales bacterium]
MLDDLLQTKLYVPQLRQPFISRPHLIDKLNQGLHRKLTLISAPAGFGKTTLVSEWISGGERPSAWLSLDENDAEPVRFLTYLVAALQRVAPEIGKAVWPGLQSSQPPPTVSVLTSLLNEIAAIPQNIILVLDDYHRVDSKKIDDALAFLLEHLPPSLHLVITSREDPQLPLAGLRARGQLTELRAADLRFTPDEAAAFLNQVMGLHLSSADVTSLETRTEGWIAGLQLAALALQGQGATHGEENRSQFIKAFAGDNRYIVDYLIEEVLHRQPDHIRSFLLQTSLLERLYGPLCDAVTGQTNGSRLLETLERSNLFVIPLDDKRHWYRYHHLFASVLQTHLQKQQPDQVSILHLRASQWCEQNGLPATAIHHALASDDLTRAADLIELAWPPIYNGFQPARWLGWVHALPDEIIQTRPVLSAGSAWTLLDSGEPEAAEAHLRAAEGWLSASADEQPATTSVKGNQKMRVVNKKEFQLLPASIASARAYLALILGDVSTTVEYARQALELFPKDEYYQRGIAEQFLGLANWTSGDLEAAYQSISDSVANLRLAGNSYFQIVSMVFQANIRVAQGRRQEAAAIYEQSLQLTAEQVEVGGVADLYVGLGELYRESGDLETAVKYLLLGKKLSKQAILPGSESRWRAAMARVKIAEGDLDSALDLLHEVDRLYDPFPDLRPTAALRAQVWVAQGRLAPALDWAEKRVLGVDDELSYLREFEYLTLARILIAQYRQDRKDDALDRAIRLLSRLMRAAETGGRGRSQIEILILQALVYQEQDEMSQALAALQNALTLAEPEGYIRVFADEGQPMRQLLAANLAQGAAPVFISRLMQAIDSQPGEASPPPDPNQLLIDPLSDRELEVLGLMANGFSNQAIADELVIALSTVKKHVNNIFGKLHVTSRTQAVNRVRDLNIL